MSYCKAPWSWWKLQIQVMIPCAIFTMSDPFNIDIFTAINLYCPTEHLPICCECSDCKNLWKSHSCRYRFWHWITILVPFTWLIFTHSLSVNCQWGERWPRPMGTTARNIRKRSTRINLKWGPSVIFFQGPQNSLWCPCPPSSRGQSRGLYTE